MSRPVGTEASRDVSLSGDTAEGREDVAEVTVMKEILTKV
jgi:hypothetical protein